MKKMNKKGFTLIEMLVVIAIIAVLVAIVIPTVGNATEKAKEAADAANIRAAIATVTTNALGNGSAADVPVPMTQKGTFVTEGLTNIGGFPISTFENKTSVTVKWDAANNKVTIDGVAATEPTTPSESTGN